jgi:8-oxo-dGTP pyrophosphatase MutT (NUDIX family)
MSGPAVATPASSASAPGDVPRRQRIAVYGLCRNDAGDFLLVRAAPHLTVAGRWFLPGGGVDHAEQPVDALRREIAEETGLDATVGDLLGVLADDGLMPDGTHLHTVRIIYRVDSFTGTLRDEADGTSDVARFVPADELARMPLMPYGVRVLTEFAGVEGLAP